MIVARMKSGAVWPPGGNPAFHAGYEPSAAAAEYLNIEIADLLAQRVAVDAEQVGGADLVAAGGRERHRQERMLDLAQHPMIEPGRRQLVAEAREVGRQMPLDRGRKPLLRARLLVGRRHCRLRELGVDDRRGDRLL